jgi:hypothetical protein
VIYYSVLFIFILLPSQDNVLDIDLVFIDVCIYVNTCMYIYLSLYRYQHISLESDPNEEAGSPGPGHGSNGVSTIENGVRKMFADVGLKIFESLQVTNNFIFDSAIS